jgi:hypothetical protein
MNLIECVELVSPICHLDEQHRMFEALIEVETDGLQFWNNTSTSNHIHLSSRSLTDPYNALKLRLNFAFLNQCSYTLSDEARNGNYYCVGSPLWSLLNDLSTDLNLDYKPSNNDLLSSIDERTLDVDIDDVASAFKDKYSSFRGDNLNGGRVLLQT